MKAGIIAAGRGERLKKEGVLIPKPLISVCGQTLIERAIRISEKVGVSSVACIVNDVEKEVERYIRSKKWKIPLNLIVKTTRNSMESFLCLKRYLDEPFLLFMVDSVFRFESMKRFLNKIREFRSADGVLALTRYVDDERPLWVKLDKGWKVTHIGVPFSGYVTAGFYYFKPSVFDFADEVKERMSALREYFAFLIKKGYNIYGVDVGKVVDVDHVEDIKKAEELIGEDTWDI